MNYSSLTKDDLKDHLFSLMDQVIHHLAAEPDVDKFLDQTDIFEDWEKVLPEEEYPISKHYLLLLISKWFTIKLIS